MPKYELIYFPLRGRAEGVRYMFAYAGVKFTDTRIAFGEWGTLKPKTPFGGIPLLKVDDQEPIAQCPAIIRYLAKQPEFDMNGTTDREAAFIDMYKCAIDDIRDNAIADIKHAHMAGHDDQVKDILSKKRATLLEPFCKRFHNFLEKNGTGFLVGNKPSYADFELYYMLQNLEDFDKTLTEPYPKTLKAFIEKFSNFPGIKAYLAERPVTKI